MRIPLVTDVESRDGTSNKDSRLYNVLVEDDGGVKFSGVRPALEAIVTATGNGNGVVELNGVLISVFGTVLGFGEGPSVIGAVENKPFEFCQSPL